MKERGEGRRAFTAKETKAEDLVCFRRDRSRREKRKKVYKFKTQITKGKGYIYEHKKHK
jgi:hypothetical protein